MNQNTKADALSGHRRELPAAGQYYRHFKGIVVKIICVARHTESGKMHVVYQDDRGNRPWTRPLNLFLSKVDKEKYPDSKQENRFELILEDEGEA